MSEQHKEQKPRHVKIVDVLSKNCQLGAGKLDNIHSVGVQFCTSEQGDRRAVINLVENDSITEMSLPEIIASIKIENGQSKNRIFFELSTGSDAHGAVQAVIDAGDRIKTHIHHHHLSPKDSQQLAALREAVIKAVQNHPPGMFEFTEAEETTIKNVARLVAPDAQVKR